MAEKITDWLIQPMDQMDLQPLLAGQVAPWRRFVDTSAPLVLATVRRIFTKYGRTGSAAEHEDVSQEVYLKFARDDYQLLRRFDPTKAKLSTFVGVVTRSTAIDYLRKLKPAADDIDDHAEKLAASTNGFGAHDAPSFTSYGSTTASIFKALPNNLISDKQRHILCLLYDHDLDPEDVAKQLGVETQTIRSAKHKAITKIRQHLANMPEAERPL